MGMGSGLAQVVKHDFWLQKKAVVLGGLAQRGGFVPAGQAGPALAAWTSGPSLCVSYALGWIRLAVGQCKRVPGR